jgi:hypothetical protein
MEISVSFTSRPLQPVEKRHQNKLQRRVSGPQRHLDMVGRNISPLSGVKPRFLGRLACSLVAGTKLNWVQLQFSRSEKILQHRPRPLPCISSPDVYWLVILAARRYIIWDFKRGHEQSVPPSGSKRKFLIPTFLCCKSSQPVNRYSPFRGTWQSENTAFS